MAKIWRKAIENGLDEKDVKLLNILAEERKFMWVVILKI